MRRLVVALVLALAAAAPARAAHPILSEDPETQGTGGVELEFGFSATRGEPGGGRTSQLAVQLAYGLAPTLDLLIAPRYLVSRPADAPRERGFGDTSLDLKWRFVETERLQVALRAGAELPTGDADRGLGAPGKGIHALVALAWQIAPVNWLVNVGYTRSRAPGQRTSVPFASTAVVYPAREPAPWQTFVEVAAQANSDPARSTWPAVARTGLIWRVAEGLDLDVGLEGRLNRSATRAVFLLGATLWW